MGILSYPDLIEELDWIEKTDLSAGHRMVLNMWIIIEASRRDGLTYEMMKAHAIKDMNERIK